MSMLRKLRRAKKELPKDQAIMAGPGYEIKRSRHGVMMYNPKDLYVGKSFREYGEFSEAEVAFFANTILPGSVVVDVGANIGAHTIPFSRITGKTGVVMAFEPQRLVYNMLVSNLALNGIRNVLTFNTGLSYQTGVMFLPPINYDTEENFGGISLLSEGSPAFNMAQVPVTTLDQIALSRCDFIKIDVEGMEHEVIRGAGNTIEKFRPLLYVENDRSEKSAALIKLLRELRYDLYWHTPFLYSETNFFGNRTNHFPKIVSLNMICVPRESNVPVEGFQSVGA